MKLLMAIFLGIALLMSSCKKEEVLTEGEKIGQQVQSALTTYPGIKTATFYISNAVVEQNQTFVLNEQYITTNNGTYNLSRLIRYQPFSQSITFYF